MGYALRSGYAPLLGRSLNQHESGGCSRLAHSVVERAYRVRAVRVLVAVSDVAKTLLNLYSLPIRVQLIGNNERQCGAACGAHLRATGHDPYRAVRIDSEVHAGM